MGGHGRIGVYRVTKCSKIGWRQDIPTDIIGRELYTTPWVSDIG